MVSPDTPLFRFLDRVTDFIVWCFEHPLISFIGIMAALILFTTPPEAWAELRKPLPRRRDRP